MSYRWVPDGLRSRLLVPVIASVAFSTLLMFTRERDLRAEAVQRASAEAGLLSRLAAGRAEQLLRDAPLAPLGMRDALPLIASAARNAGAVVRADHGAALPEAVSFVVVDRRGRVLAEPGAAGPRGDLLITSFPARAGVGWEQDVRGADGRRHLVAFSPLTHVNDASLWLGACVDMDALLADLTRGMWRSLAGVVLLGLVMSFIVWWVVGVGVLRRVNALLEATRRLGSGDLAARTGLAGGPGELGALARQFDSMAEELERREAGRARAREELRLSEARKSAVLEASLDGIVLLDEGGRMMECNAAARRLFGCNGHACVHHGFTEMFPESLPFDFLRFNRPSEVLETSCRRLDHSVLPVEISIAPVRDAAVVGLFAATVRDISERQRMQNALEKLSFMDDLTGLYNRRGFLMFAAHQLRLAARNDLPVVLVSVDVDGLKAINDAFGHANGDRALIEVAQALHGSFRDSDIIGRIGGDEFVVLAIESQGEGAEHALERFAMRIAGRNGEDDLPWRLGASVGWVRAQPDDPDDLAELLERVDERMYEQKRRNSGEAVEPRAAGLFPDAPPAVDRSVIRVAS